MPPQQETGKNPGAQEPLRLFLCFSSREISELLTFALDGYFNCQITTFTDVNELLAALQAAPPRLLVLDGAREDCGVALEGARTAGCKVAVHHPQKKPPPAIEGLKLAGVYGEAELLMGVSAVLRSLGAKANDPAMSEGNPCYPYFRVGLPLLLRTSPLVCDVFIRLTDLKYVKLFHEGEAFGSEELARYKDKKKIDYLYVRHIDAERVTGRLNEALETLLRQSPLPQEVSTPVSLAAIDTVHSLVRQVGFTPEVQRLVKNAAELVLKEMYASPSLSDILKNLHVDREKYIAAHSHLLAEVSCALSIAMKWDSETSFKKLTMAALLHDMSLSNQKLARVKDLKELAQLRADFDHSEVEEYRSHTRRASILVKGIKEVPADVDKIILQHHELPTGLGFPEQVNHTHIHPLASLIMVAHDLVDWVFDRPDRPLELATFIEAHAEKYRVGNFRKLLKALELLQE